VAQETNAPTSKASKIFERELPNVPGKSMRAVLVKYGPGAVSPSHRHPSSAFIYATVFEGEIRSKFKGPPGVHVYKAGEGWTEMPGDNRQDLGLLTISYIALTAWLSLSVPSGGCVLVCTVIIKS
jgi:quercetin dioxygenase-like cupin family protein